MPRYSEEFKEQVVSRLMPPNAQSVAQVSREVGVPAVTLYNWRNQYQDRGSCLRKKLGAMVSHAGPRLNFYVEYSS